MVVTGVFGLLVSLVHESNNFVKSAELFAVVISLAILDANFLGNVHAHSVEDVHEIVHVNFASDIPIIDVANPQNFFSILENNKASLNRKKYIFWVQYNKTRITEIDTVRT